MGYCCNVDPAACPICGDASGVVHLPADLYEPAEFPCPLCQPDAYPSGFAGVKAQPETVYQHWLIPPIQAA